MLLQHLFAIIADNIKNIYRKGNKFMTTDRKYTIKYAAVHGFYWAAFCSLLSFTAVYLLDKGFNNLEIGIVIAASNVTAVFLQPLIAGMADKNARISVKKIIGYGTGVLVLAAIGLILANRAFVLSAVLMAAAVIAITVMQPFINTLAVQMEERGIHVNFGLCRACGSLSYAFVSAALGMLLKNSSAVIIPIAAAALTILLFISTAALAAFAAETGNGEAEQKAGGNGHPVRAQGLLSFMLANKKFLLFLIGISFVFYFHVISCNYLIQIILNVGGDSGDMGIASAVSAVVELPAMILFSRLVKRFGCRRLLQVSGLFFAIKSILFFMAQSVGMIYAAQLLQAGGYALFIPASVYYVGRLLDKADMMKGQSLVTTAVTLGGVFSSIIGGRLLDIYGVRMTLLTCVVFTAIGAACMAWGAEEV